MRKSRKERYTAPYNCKNNKPKNLLLVVQDCTSDTIDYNPCQYGECTVEKCTLIDDKLNCGKNAEDRADAIYEKMACQCETSSHVYEGEYCDRK